MTTQFEATKTCGLCGKRSQHTGLRSTNSCGHCDLDFRHPPMKRWTMDTWVQRCPHCGLCARNLEEPAKDLSDAVQSPAYRAMLKNPDLPGLANKFACLSHLEQARGQTLAASWSMISAAWVCDDDAGQGKRKRRARAEEKARKCRQLAIELLETALAEPGFEDRQPGLTQLVLVDLARRAARFDAATKYADQAAAVATDETLLAIVDLQRRLITTENTGRHTLGALSSKT